MSAEHLESSSFDNTVVETSDKNPDYKLVYENAVEDKDKAHEIAKAIDHAETLRAKFGQEAMKWATHKSAATLATQENISTALRQAQMYRNDADAIAAVVDSTYDRVAALQGKIVPSKEKQDN